MLSKLELSKFRGFSKHSITFRNMALAVGKNNAGKSTIVEALRLVALVTQRASKLTFREPPKWLKRPAGSAGVSPSLANIDFEFTYIIHGYGKPPAVIKAIFADGKEIIIYLNNEAEEIFVVLRDQSKKLIISRAQLNRSPFHKVSILPPIFPVQKHELVVRKSYVRRKMATNLASSHFRNQLDFFYGPYEELKTLAEETWKGIQIQNIEIVRQKRGRPEIQLWIRDGKHVSEIADVGHGLQSWLQILWFLVRTPLNHTIILDEPDVYLHADLQRRLIQILSSRHKQVIVATHSIEMMSEISPESILIIDRESPTSRYADSFPAAQSIVDSFGSPHNLQLARLWKSKRCVFMEGNDVDYFRIFYRKLFPGDLDTINNMPIFDIGGSANWQKAAGAAFGLRQAGGENMSTYCILDSDFRTPADKQKLIEKGRESGLSVRFWERSEIENYLLEPAAIARLIAQRSTGAINLEALTEEVRQKIEGVCEELKDDIVDEFASEYKKWHKKTELKTANKWARSKVNKNWDRFSTKIKLTPGKEIRSALSGWSKRNYGVSFSGKGLANAIYKDEIAPEIVEVLTRIRACKPID